MSFDIPEKISKEEWEKLPDSQKPIFRQSEKDQNFFEYAVPAMFNSMKNAKAEREAEKKAREEAEQKLNAFAKIGDPTVFEDLMQREKLLREGTKTMEEAIVRANREAEQKYAGIVSGANKRIKELEERRKQDYQDNIVSSLLESSGVDPAYKDEVRMSFSRLLKTEMKDDVPSTFVMDPEKPNELMKDPQTFDPVSPQRAFQIFKQSKARLFKGDSGDNSGAGFGGGKGSDSGSFDTDPLTWSFETKKSFFASMGKDAKDAYEKRLNAWAHRREREKKAS